MAGWFPLFASGAPSGRSTVGFSAGDPGFLKNLAQTGNDLHAGTYNYLPFMDANGYPNSNGGNPSNTITYGLQVPSDIVANSSTGSNDGTEMILSWTGSATNASGAMGTDFGSRVVSISSDPDGLVVSDLSLKFYVSNNASKTSGGKVRFYFNTVSPTMNFSFVGGSTFSSVNNLVICRASDWASFVDASTYAITATKADDLIYAPFVAEYQSLNFSVSRPMGWTNPNDGNNCSRHSFRIPWKTGLGFCGAPMWRPECIAGDNGSGAAIVTGTNTYAAAAATGTPGSYTDGETIQGQFANANTGSGPFTLNVGARGAKPLIDTLGSAITAGAIAANSFGTAVYSSIFDSWMFTPYGMTTYVPIEIQVGYANRANTHIWINFPPFFDSASVNGVGGIVRDNLNAILSAWFEYANEVWNFQFPFSHFAASAGVALGFDTSDNRHINGFYALKIAQLFPSLKTTWTSTRSATQLNRVLAFQSVADPSATELYRMKCVDLAPSGTHTGVGNSVYNSYTGSADFTQSPNRAVDQIEVLSFAPYYSGGESLQFSQNYKDAFDAGLSFGGLTAAADDYASGNPSQMTSALTWLDNDTQAGAKSDGSHSDTLSMQDYNGTGGLGRDYYTRWDTLAASYSKWVDLYEGAYSAVAPDASACTYIGISTGYATSVANLITAYKNSTKFYNATQIQFQQFMSRSRSRTPVWFLVAGLNAWSLKSGDSLTVPHFKSYDMVKDWNHGIG